jgi:hypothetical protein
MHICIVIVEKKNIALLNVSLWSSGLSNQRKSPCMRYGLLTPCPKSPVRIVDSPRASRVRPVFHYTTEQEESKGTAELELAGPPTKT